MWMDVDTAVQVPVSLMPLVDRTDFITIEDAIAFDETGIAVAWNFVTTAGVMTTTAITPTAASNHDWLEEGTNQGMYSIEIPASAGDASNDTEGVGWITGETDSCLPFRGPTVGFRAAALNNALIDGGDNLDTNVVQWLGTAVSAGTAGIPNVNVEEINNDTIAVHTLRDWMEKGTRLTSDSGTTTTLVDAGLTEDDNHWNGSLLIFRTGTNSGHTAIVTDFDAASDTLTFTPAVPNAVTTMGYALIPGLGWSDVQAWLGTAPAAPDTAGIPKVNTEEVAGTIQTAGDLAALIVTADAAIDVAVADLANATDGLGAIKDETALIVADTNELQTDNVPGLIATAQADLDIITGAAGALLDTTATSAQLVDDVWDEVLNKAGHDVAQSAGKRLRQIETSFVITSGTAQAGTANTITLAAGESATNDIFAGDRVIIVDGTGVGEHGIITTYDGGTKVATMSQNWVITPIGADSEYELTPADVDVETWQHAIVTLSATSNLPEVDTKSVSDDATAADNLELFTEGTALGTLPQVDTQQINAANVVGDGNATPWDGA